MTTNGYGFYFGGDENIELLVTWSCENIVKLMELYTLRR